MVQGNTSAPLCRNGERVPVVIDSSSTNSVEDTKTATAQPDCRRRAFILRSSLSPQTARTEIPAAQISRQQDRINSAIQVTGNRITKYDHDRLGDEDYHPYIPMCDIWINEIMTEEQQKRTQLAERYYKQTMGRADED